MKMNFNIIYFRFKDRDELRRQLSDIKKDYDKQNNILQKCLAVNKKLLVEKVCITIIIEIFKVYKTKLEHISQFNV